ncbi:MAG TPA: hypothetical protein VE981_09835 [Planctomycetota bacterium]|nr:hypothetical protein [Planctomycetota bacterium]
MAELKRSSLGTIFIVGLLLLGLAAGVVLVPLWKCPECEVLNDTRATFVRRPECRVCGGSGKVNLLRRWSVVQELRGNGLTIDLLPR